MKIETFDGQHCETTATGALLANLGLNYSEAMLFGIGQGLGYGVFKFGNASFPFIGGRSRSLEITKNLCSNLGLKLNIQKTTSVKKAWNNAKECIDNVQPVGLQLDMYYLDYFTSGAHFAGHFVCMYDYDDEYAYLIDTAQQGKYCKTTLASLAEARSSKQPMCGKNTSYTIENSANKPVIEQAITNAIITNATEFLNPPIKNLGYKGIIKTADMLKKYYAESDDVCRDFKQSAIFMEKAGTGGSLFRNMYRDFLKESIDILGSKVVPAHSIYTEVAEQWHNISLMFDMVGNTGSDELLPDISANLKSVAEKEYNAMNLLLQTLAKCYV